MKHRKTAIQKSKFKAVLYATMCALLLFIIVKMRVENAQVIFFVQNSFSPKDNRDKSGSGVGMENIRQRLKKDYPNKYNLIQNKVNNYLSTTLSIPI